MKGILKRFSILIGFFVLLIVLTTDTLIMRHLLDVQSNDQSWLDHSQRVQTQVAEIKSLLANAETGERGYIYTHDPRFLGPYGLAVAQLDPSVQQLEKLTVDNSREQARIIKLRSLVQTKLQMLSTTIMLLQSGYPNYANEGVVSERGRLLLMDINSLMTDITLEETSLDGSRSATYQVSRNRTINSIYVTSGAVALGLVLLAFHILNEFRLRDRRAQQRLASEKWFRSTLRSLGHAVIATDNRGIVTFMNPKAEQLMGVRLSSAKGRPVEKVFPVLDRTTLKPIDSFVTKFIEHGYSDYAEHGAFIRGNDGKLIPIKNNATLIKDRRDRLLGAVLAFQPLTIEHQSRSVSFSNNIAVSPMILATASHHIDSPLIAASDLIYCAKLNEGVPTDAFDLLTLAESHLGRASHISREILGFYRQTEAFERLDMSVLLDAVLRSFSSKFASKNITVVRDFNLCPCVNGISAEIKQAISNVVANAVDAVPVGGTIRAQLSCSADVDASAISLSIRDNGAGIGAADRHHLFEPFFTTKDGIGYGLGLWTSRGIIERHGGMIQVEHQDGSGIAGTVFKVLLPVEL